MSSLRKIRIEYDGGPGCNAKIVDADTGEQIEAAYRVEFSLEATGTPRAVIYTYMPVTNIVTDAEIKTTCPYCKQEVPLGGNDDAS